MRLRAILFDYGGTLDGNGVHWLDRFLHLYQQAGLALSFERFRPAFDHATQCGYAEPLAAGFDLQELARFHVARQLEHLQIRDAALTEAVASAFVAATRAALAESRAVLQRLRPRVALGVISNFYGNLDRILEEAGMTPLLSAVIDSARVGVSKPDAQIFRLAVCRVGCQPADALYVGDSFEKDIVAAHAAGLRTAWLVGPAERPCCAPECVDVRVRRLAELEALLE